MSSDDLTTLKDRMALSDLAGHYTALKRDGKKDEYVGCCPLPGHVEKTPSFRVYDATGRYHCFGCGGDGDHFDFIGAVEGLPDLPDQVRRFREIAGLPEGASVDISPAARAERDHVRRQQAAEARAERDRKRSQARALWTGAEPLQRGSPAGLYLAGRGLGPDVWPRAVREHGFPDLRFAPACYHGGSGGDVPALLARVSLPDGRFAGVWRIWLDPDDPGGAGPARDRKGRIAGPGSKKALGSTRDDDGGQGCAWLLRPGEAGVPADCDTLIVGEGLETSLAAIPLRARLTAPPVAVAALLASGFLASFVPPRWVRTLIVLGEEDQASRKALYGPDDPGQRDNCIWLQKTCAARGIALRVIWPRDWGLTDKGADALDVWTGLAAGTLTLQGDPDGVPVEPLPELAPELAPEVAEEDAPGWLGEARGEESENPAPPGEEAGQGAEKPRRGRPAKASGVRAAVERILFETPLLTDDAGTVFRYSGGAWSPMSDQWLKSLCWRALPDASQSFRSDLAQAIKARSYEEGLAWARVGLAEIPCRNGILDVLTGELRDHDPGHRLERVLPWDYDATARCPEWMQVLVDWFGESAEQDGGRSAAIQEYFGYICLTHAKYKKAMLLYGPSNCGKSLVVHLAQALVSERYTCQLSVSHMDDPTRRAVLVGKALNVMSELSAGEMIADGGFKQLVSTEEPVLIDEKYKPGFMYTPTAKHVIATNTLPHSSDRTEAVLNRLLIVPFTAVFDEKDQRRDLPDILRDEMPGVLAWAVDGARRLCARGGIWSDVPAAASIWAEYRADSNPIRQFLQENAEQTGNKGVSLRAVADRYNKWNRGGKSVTVKGIGKMLRDLHDCRIVVKDIRFSGGVRTGLAGWDLLDPVSMPDRFELDPDSVTGPEREIAALSETRTYDPDDF